MLKVAIAGSGGRMGLALKDFINSSPKRFQYVSGFSKNPKDEMTVSDLSDWNAQEIDVVVDFSLPESFEKVFSWCADNKKPLVSGTTGFEVLNYEKKATDFSFMHSGNFSLGVAGLIKSVSAFKKMSESATVWIEDYHHIKKVDSPSGTAVKISKKIKKEFGVEPEIKDVRAGSIFGVHNVHIASDQEWVTLTHRALNRLVFAEGALNAAEWLSSQKSGAYTFEDFLGF